MIVPGLVTLKFKPRSGNALRHFQLCQKSEERLKMLEQDERENVPPDFPSAQITGAVSGAAPKLLLVRTPTGGFAAPTQSEEERTIRWQKCEVLASKVARAATRSKTEKCSHMSEEAILALYLP